MSPARRLLGFLTLLGLALAASLSVAATNGGDGPVGTELAEPECWPESDMPGMDDVVAALEARASELDRKEASLLAREEDLRTAEADLLQRLDELKALRSEISDIIRETDDVEEEKIRNITRMVEAMKPKEGAAFMSSLESELAVAVLDRMNPRKSAKLVGKMAPDTAARLSLEVATVRPGGIQ